MSEFTPEKYWPLGSTVQNSLTDLQTPPSDPKRYEHFGIISVNPLSGHTILIYRKGVKHVGTPSSPDYGEIWIRHSDDGGVNWSNESQAFSAETNIDQRGVGGGYDSNGRLFAFYGRYFPGDDNPSLPAQWLSMNYRYSDDDGATWSNEQTLSHGSETAYLPYGHIVDIGNNILLQPWYGNHPIGGDEYSFSINLYKSTDGGATFSSINIYTGTGKLFVYPYDPYYTEFSIVNLGGGCFMVLARTDRKNGTSFVFRQFKSEDNCNSWYDHGNTSFETLTGNYPAPPWLSFINFEGVGIVACYYTNRGTQKMNVVYGLAKDLLENGPSAWNINTKKEIFDFWYPQSPPPQYTASGYQSFYQPLNQYKGIGVGFKESGAYLAYPIVVFTNISDMKDVLIELGL